MPQQRQCNKTEFLIAKRQIQPPTENLLTNRTYDFARLPDVTRTPIALLVLLVFCVLAYLPGISTIPPLDRDEPRFTQASRQMLDTGDYVDIRFQEEARHKKPVGIYWLQSVVVGLIGGDRSLIWKYRLVSFLGAILAVLLTFWTARAFLAPESAFFAALLFAATILIGVEAHIAKTDAALLAVIVLAQGILARIWAEPSPRGRGFVAMFWLCLGLGILIKGPIVFLVCGGTLAALCLWDRDLRWLKRLNPVSGVPLMLLIAMPWYVLIGFTTDGAFYHEAIGKDFLGKIASGQESHGAPPGVHTAVMLATFWPASAFLLATLPNIRRTLGHPGVKFALCWAVPTWLVFELTATKLPHYVLPVFPALAILTLLLMDETARRPSKPWLLRLAALILALAPLVIAVASVAVPRFLNGPIVWPAVIVLAGAAGIAAMAAHCLLKQAYPKSMTLAATTSVLISFGAYGLALPQLSPLWISSQIVAAAKRGSACADPQIVSVGWREPSLVFLAGTDTALKTAESALEEAGRDGCAVFAIERPHDEAFGATAARQGIRLAPIGAVEGFTLNGGDAVHITLYQKTGP